MTIDTGCRRRWCLQMWPGLIQKAKDGGLDVIETYVFWDIHEPVRGQARTNTTPPTLPVMLLLFSSIFIVFVFFFTFPNHLLLLATIMCQTKGSGARPVFASSAPYALFSLFFSSAPGYFASRAVLVTITFPRVVTHQV